VNNERKQMNWMYAKSLDRLENFVMVMFERDKTVISKESRWFTDVNVTDSGKEAWKLRDGRVIRRIGFGSRLWMRRVGRRSRRSRASIFS